MIKPKKILVTRFSALGDVAMTIPVIKQFLSQNQNIEIIFVSRKNVASLFFGIERLKFYAFEPDSEHKGIMGLFRLFLELKKQKINAYADLHNVLRTHILRFLFTLNGIPVKKIDKGRAKKKALSRKDNKNKIQLKSNFERYADVFRALGFEVSIPKLEAFPIRKEQNKIGIAPFAQHKGKIYPLEKMQEIAVYFANKNYEILLFGGGKTEKSILQEWTKLHHNISVVSAQSLADEVEIMRQLAFMISMDSANMHLASLAETAVFSFWGATHPFAGFLGYRQNEKYIIQQEELQCRPCSIYGNKSCYRKDYACLYSIEPVQFIKQIENFLK